MTTQLLNGLEFTRFVESGTVIVSEVESPRCFYVQNPAAKNKLRQLAKQILDHVNATQPMSDLKNGEL